MREFPKVRDELQALRRFVSRTTTAEHCNICGAPLESHHQHLVEPATRKVVSACDVCAILFSDQSEQRYRRVPRSARVLAEFNLSDAQWEKLMIPIGLAFFFHSTPAAEIVAVYPGQAGATESFLPLDAWDHVVKNNPILTRLSPDVEALLVNRTGQAPEYYLAPIDECYKLVGIIRADWRGLDGGVEFWNEIEHFFWRLKERSTAAVKKAHA